MQIIEEDIADRVMDSNKYYQGEETDSSHEEEPDLEVDSSVPPVPKHLSTSKVHIIPTSDHNMHMDNPKALAAAIINDIYGLRLPLEPNELLIRAAMGDACFD